MGIGGSIQVQNYKENHSNHCLWQTATTNSVYDP